MTVPSHGTRCVFHGNFVAQVVAVTGSVALNKVQRITISASHTSLRERPGSGVPVTTLSRSSHRAARGC